MHVAVLGASGKAGSELCKELVSRGHKVLGIARKPEAIPELDGVTAKAGDATDPDALAELIKGVDAVISAIHFDVSADTLLSAVKKAGVSRLIITGGAASLEVAPGVMLYDSPDFPENIKPFVKPAIDFLEDIRKETEVDWTFFSPAMVFFVGPRVGTFRTGGDQLITDANGESKISYADAAIAMVDELENPKYSRARFTASY